ECSVSKTADILGQAQPTVSLTLKRLREMLHSVSKVRSVRIRRTSIIPFACRIMISLPLSNVQQA
ncbi:hypothetical protein ACC685_37250, partial [Rhizobium ruizarguesonis]